MSKIRVKDIVRDDEGRAVRVVERELDALDLAEPDWVDPDSYDALTPEERALGSIAMSEFQRANRRGQAYTFSDEAARVVQVMLRAGKLN